MYLKMVRYGMVWYEFLFFFYNLPAVDRGDRPLLATHHRCPHLHYAQLATAHPTPIISCYRFLFSSGDIFQNVAHHVDLLAAEGGLDIRVAEDKHLKTISPPKSSACPRPRHNLKYMYWNETNHYIIHVLEFNKHSENVNNNCLYAWHYSYLVPHRNLSLADISTNLRK